ncbi:MAG: glycosyltransferase family 4 protein [Candidatus Krumholzibacteriia bacterium]
MRRKAGPTHLVFFIPEDWYVCSHRLPLVRAAAAEGWRVSVVTRVQDHAGPIRDAGAEVVPVGLRRGFQDPWSDGRGLAELVRIFRRLRPDLLHQVTPKSVLYGSAAAALAGRPPVINALAGLGYLYTSAGPRARLARPAVTLALKAALGTRRSWLIVQNDEDAAFFRDTLGVPPARISLIPGAGVDAGAFAPPPAPAPGPVRFVLPARMLVEKGIAEFVEAAGMVRAEHPETEFVLAGTSDPENPSGLPEKRLAAWHAQGVVRWLGHVADMPGLLASCHVAVLPTYREGFPKALLEAAATGLPLVASDVAGCRPVCRPGRNGLLVAPRDVRGLAGAMSRLAADPGLRRSLGEGSRALVLEEFTEDRIAALTLDLYRTVLDEGGAGA